MKDFTPFLPHIKYMYASKTIPYGSNDESVSLYYLGGSEYNNLIVGQLYQLNEALYAEKMEDKRKHIWFFIDKESSIKYHFNNLDCFGDIVKLRENQIDKIMFNGNKMYASSVIFKFSRRLSKLRKILNKI